MAPRKVKIKTVFFDIGNVLLHFNLRDVARGIGWAVRKHPIKVIRYIWKQSLVEGIERGEIGPKLLYGMFKEEFEYKGSYQDFCVIFSDYFTLDKATAELYEAVTKTHKVYLLSNTNHIHYEFIKKHYTFPKMAHGAVLSYKIGMRKPEARIYKKALQMARAKAESSLFIDDNWDNVKAARKLGITALLYKGGRNLKKELANLGVLQNGSR